MVISTAARSLRRPLATVLGPWLLLLLVVTLFGLPAARAETQILLVATPADHPWGSHMYQFECEVLARCLNQTEGVAATTTLNWPPEPERLRHLKSIVFYSRPVGDMVLHPDHRADFLRLMQEGVGLVAIHWSTGVGYGPLADDPQVRDEFKAILGGWFRRPPGNVTIGTSSLVQVDPQHPVCRGWQGYPSKDEFYLDLVFHEQVHPILQVNVDGRDQTVAWSFERSGERSGRSFGITLGHYHDNFANPDFRRALVNGILWTAHVDPPAGGAPVALSEEELRLPTP